MKTFRVNPTDYYPYLKDNPYDEFYGDSKPEETLYRQGDVVYDTNHKTVAIVLGVIDTKGGELRLSSDGMQPIENIRFATLEDLEGSDGRVNKQLFLDCCKQQGVVPMKFRVTAKIVKDVIVYVTPEEMNQDEIEEMGKEMAHQQFNPNKEGTEEKYDQSCDLMEL
jgi:hypothetical protein